MCPENQAQRCNNKKKEEKILTISSWINLRIVAKVAARKRKQFGRNFAMNAWINNNLSKTCRWLVKVFPVKRKTLEKSTLNKDRNELERAY